MRARARLLVGVVVARIHKLIDECPIEITLTLLVPYLAYLAAGHHASGVLAVVRAGVPEPSEFAVFSRQRAACRPGRCGMR